MTTEYPKLQPHNYIMYLRKSRADNPDETVEEVLSKHETMLQEYMKREFGFTVLEENIYREVCSGESIDSRTEIQKVLARIEYPEIAGVVVIEPSRLSRGNLLDCGRLVNDFRFTRTLIITPTITYDLEDKMMRKFFQDELLRGSDYLEYTKEILLRGRIASVKRGNYIGVEAPYGYDKIRIGKDCTLAPNDNAIYVQMIFNWYLNDDLTYYQVACKLNEMGVPSPRGKKWQKDIVRHILMNDHYIGMVHFSKTKETTIVEHGRTVKKRLRQDPEKIIRAEGKHQAIIEKDIFEKVQEKINLLPQHAKAKDGYPIQNPLAGIVKCGICGKALYYHPYSHAGDRLSCRTRPKCFKSMILSEAIETVTAALETVELPRLEAKLKNGDGDAAKIQKTLLSKLEKQLADFKVQEDKQYEFLETGRYTEEVFEARHAALRGKMEKCQSQIREARASIPKHIDYGEKVLSLKKAISALRDDSMTPKEKNDILKAIVEKISITNKIKTGEGHRGENELEMDIFLRL